MLLIHIFGLAKCLKTAYFCSGRSSVETSVVEDVLDRVSKKTFFQNMYFYEGAITKKG